MEIFTTTLAIISGIDYLIIMLRFGGRWISIIQIKNQIKYYNDAKMFIEVASTIHDQKNNRIYYNMGKFFKRFSNVVKDATLYHLERKVEKQERSMAKLHQLRKERAKKQDVKKEKELFKYGIVRDGLSKHYYLPTQILADIHKALVAKYPDKKCDFDRLILNVNGETHDEDDYAEIAKCLLYIKIPDRLTELDFRCDLLQEPVYAPCNILWLQQCNKNLYKVDLKIIQHENRFVSD